MKKTSVLIIAACSTGLVAQAQLIDAFNGESLSGYTDTLVLDNSSGAGSGVSFSDSTGSMVASFSGATSDPEQALFLTPTSLPVGDALVVYPTMSYTTTTEDLGIAISATATPAAAGSGNAYNSRATFDWASISVRPSQTSIRQNSSISGAVTTSADVINGVSANTVAQLFIENMGGGSFTLGYVDTSDVIHTDDTLAFSGSSAIGAAIGIYGDIRTTGTSLGGLNNLTIEPNAAVPEPTSLALLGMGLACTYTMVRRNRK